LNNTAKPMTFKSGERLFKIFIVSFEVVWNISKLLKTLKVHKFEKTINHF
jgi:hypothetical protein